jgi:hypothetical protein
MRERNIVDAIRRRVKVLGGKCYKIHGTQFGIVGAPDLIGCCLGIPFAVEVKMPGAGATPRQLREVEEWGAQGWAAGVVRSVEQFDALVRAARRSS